MCDDSLDKDATGPMFDLHLDTLPLHHRQERGAGQLSLPTPPALLLQPLFRCHVNDSSLPAPVSDAAVGPPPVPPTSLLLIKLEDLDPQTSLQSKTRVVIDEVTDGVIQEDACMLESSLDMAVIRHVLDLHPKKTRQCFDGPGGLPIAQHLKSGCCAAILQPSSRMAS